MTTINTSPNYDGPEDADNDFMCAAQLQRIATSLEEILRCVGCVWLRRAAHCALSLIHI